MNQRTQPTDYDHPSQAHANELLRAKRLRHLIFIILSIAIIVLLIAWPPAASA